MRTLQPWNFEVKNFGFKWVKIDKSIIHAPKDIPNIQKMAKKLKFRIYFKYPLQTIVHCQKLYLVQSKYFQVCANIIVDCSNLFSDSGIKRYQQSQFVVKITGTYANLCGKGEIFTQKKYLSFVSGTYKYNLYCLNAKCFKLNF